MDVLIKDLPDNISLKDQKNPLTAVAKGNPPDTVYKFSYHPKTGRFLYCYPGEFHIDAMNKAGDEDEFDNYVRVIYDCNNNVAGSRIWGEANYENRDLEADAKSFDAQYAAYKVFIKFDPKLKWVFNLSQKDVTDDGRENLDLSKVSKDRILDETQVEELKKNFSRIHEDQKFKGYWGLKMKGYQVSIFLKHM